MIYARWWWWWWWWWKPVCQCSHSVLLIGFAGCGETSILINVFGNQINGRLLSSWLERCRWVYVCARWLVGWMVEKLKNLPWIDRNIRLKFCTFHFNGPAVAAIHNARAKKNWMKYSRWWIEIEACYVQRICTNATNDCHLSCHFHMKWSHSNRMNHFHRKRARDQIKHSCQI